jgi:hypothetical protein
VGADDDVDDLAVSDATAKTLSERAVFVEPHAGHFAFTSPLIVRCNCSNFALHFWQMYS